MSCVQNLVNNDIYRKMTFYYSCMKFIKYDWYLNKLEASMESMVLTKSIHGINLNGKRLSSQH
jgi:hypothetical protein